MFDRPFLRSLAALLAVALLATVGQAVEIITVPVGNTDNVGEQSRLAAYDDATYYGGVDYAYNIGKYEVTAGQYAEFLNAVAKSDPYGLYDMGMDLSSSGSQITRSGSSGSYSYDFSGRPSGTEADWVDRPMNSVRWGHAARFCNWLENGQPKGILTGIPELDAGLTEDGSYVLNGATTNEALQAVTRKVGATWVIPSEDEWYKAAYYDPGNPGGEGYWNYPTGDDSEPSNDLIEPTDLGNNATFNDNGYTIDSPYYRTEFGAHENSNSPYDTFDQGGNVREWTETVLSGSLRGLRGGGWRSPVWELHASDRYGRTPTQGGDAGFRVASIPEPSTVVLLAVGAVGLLAWVWRKRRPAAAARCLHSVIRFPPETL